MWSILWWKWATSRDEWLKFRFVRFRQTNRLLHWATLQISITNNTALFAQTWRYVCTSICLCHGCIILSHTCTRPHGAARPRALWRGRDARELTVSPRERARAAMAALDRRNPNLDDFVGLNWSCWADRVNILPSDGESHSLPRTRFSSFHGVGVLWFIVCYIHTERHKEGQPKQKTRWVLAQGEFANTANWQQTNKQTNTFKWLFLTRAAM